MKTLIIRFTDDAYAQFKNAVTIKHLAGTSYGTLDNVTDYILFAIEHGMSEKTFITRKEAGKYDKKPL